MTDRIHDFTAKLRQPAVTGVVESYLRWQRKSDRARLGDRDAYASTATGRRLARSIGDFDASRACREVTCLYDSVNWWLEKRLNEPGDAAEGECDAKPLDFFL